MAIFGTLVGENDLSTISASISDTAVDVFVYDTAKDSDGGAWRKRTQNTSWYNETLNTATRGSRKDFPAVAVIVAEATKVTIYDGDDPDMPMWMVFNQGGSYVTSNNLIGTTSGTNSAISSLNGILSLTTGNEALYLIKFISDTSHRITNSADREYLGGIGERNSGKGLSSSNSTNYIINANCNDVAMTVLPNAPIDSATELPVPTIAVATDGGVSVIKDDGTVVDITSSKAVNDVDLIHFDKSGRLYFAAQASSSVTDVYQFNRYVIPSSDISNNVYEEGADATYFSYATSGSFANMRPNFNALYNDDTNEDITSIVSNNDGGVVGNVNGLSLFVEDYESQNNGMVAFVASDYNTGYQHGDIKGAFLSDTDTTNATELVTNGYFDSNVNDWIAAIGTATLDSNRLLITAPNSGASWGYAHTSITTEIGKTYKISLKYDQGTADGRLVVKNDSTNSSAGLLKGVGVNASGWRDLGSDADGKTIFATFTATATTTFILVFSKSTSGGTSAYDQISVTLEKDRSTNGKGLSVFGTITKSAVATGAELVAYSGFSASNYLQQPYNSDLDFGTGDLNITFWFKTPNGSTPIECILHRGDGGTGTWGSGKLIQIEYNGSNLAAYLAESAFSSTDNVNIPIATAANGQWSHYSLVRHGSFFGVYFNGELMSSTTSTRDVSNTSAKTWIGERPNTSRPLTTTSLALFRISKSAPTAEQVKKMYEDEKLLFQENAKATLYGSSDAVTALAYDDTTELLHVGTSDGRSDFQGLRRINNTTDPVTTEISAHDSLITEQ